MIIEAHACTNLGGVKMDFKGIYWYGESVVGLSTCMEDRRRVKIQQSRHTLLSIAITTSNSP